MSKRRLGTDEAHRVWMAICDGRVEWFHTLICLPIPNKKPATLCSEEWRLRTANIRNTYCLFVFPSDFRRWQRPFLYAQNAVNTSDSRQARCIHPTLQAQSDRINMGTQDPKKQNL